MSNQNPTQKAQAPFTQPPKEGEQPAAARCPACKRDLLGLYLYAFQLGQPAPLPTLVFQGVCCPYDDCRTLLGFYDPKKVESPISTPRDAWM